MREMIKLMVAVVVFSAFSGGMLAALQNGTKERIEYQQLKFVKGPAILEILDGCSNDPLVDRFKVKDGDTERNIFVGEFDGKRNSVAFEIFGKGFGGNIGIVIAVNLEDDTIVGIGITTHSETPGVGSRAKTEPEFSAQFKGKSIDEPFAVKADDGQIDAVSGATVTSRGVCGALVESTEIYKRLKADIMKKIST